MVVVASAQKGETQLWLVSCSKVRRKNHLFYNTSIHCCQDKLLTVQLRSRPAMSAETHCTKTTAICKNVYSAHSATAIVKSDPLSADSVQTKVLILLCEPLFRTVLDHPTQIVVCLQHPQMESGDTAFK